MRGRRLAAAAAAIALALGLAAAALVPLRLVAGHLDLPAALSATDVSGSLWAGRLHRAHWNGRALGDIDLGLRPLPLLAGVQRVQVDTADLSFAVLQGRRRGIEDAGGSMTVEGAAALGGLDLRVDLDVASMVFDDSGCHAAGGRVRLSLSMPGASTPLLELEGHPVCDGPLARIALAPSAQAVAALDAGASVELRADASWQLHALVRSTDPATRLALQAAGFQEGPGGFSRIANGRLGDE